MFIINFVYRPLDEGKKLKEKFDAIFGTTEYNKAIDKMMKFRKEYQEKLKLSKQNKSHLAIAKLDADKKLTELEQLKEKFSSREVELVDLESKQEPIQKEIDKILKTERDYGKLSGQKTSYEIT